MSYTTVQWAPPEDALEAVPSENAYRALKCAATAAKNFDAQYEVRNQERERALPLFHAEELLLSKSPARASRFFCEYDLRSIRIVMDFTDGKFGSHVEEARSRFAERSIDGHYSVKYLQDGFIDSERGQDLAKDFILETKILMNLAAHPNVASIYGVNRVGIDAFLDTGRSGFFVITDRISETLVDRVHAWRHKKAYQGREKRFTQRLEIALDIVSALVFLHDRKIVFNVRPDKVGFDERYGRIKLFNFSQARQAGQPEQPRSITSSDDISTVVYTAPEVLCKAHTTVSSDVYAFGVMLWEIMSLKKPFEGFDRSLYFEEAVKRSGRPPINQRWPDELSSLVESCWDPHFRPTTKVVHGVLETSLLFADDVSEIKDEFRRPAVARTASADAGMQALRASLAPASPAKTIRSCQAPYQSPKYTERLKSSDRQYHSVRTSRTVTGPLNQRGSINGTVEGYRGSQSSPNPQNYTPAPDIRSSSPPRGLPRSASMTRIIQEKVCAPDMPQMYGGVRYDKVYAADDKSEDTTPTAPDGSSSSGSAEEGSPKHERRLARHRREVSRHSHESGSGNDKSLSTCNTAMAVTSRYGDETATTTTRSNTAASGTAGSSGDASLRRSRTTGAKNVRRPRSRTPTRRSRSKSRSKSPGGGGGGGGGAPSKNHRGPSLARRSSRKLSQHNAVMHNLQHLDYNDGSCDGYAQQLNPAAVDARGFDNVKSPSAAATAVIHAGGFDNIQPSGFDNERCRSDISANVNAEAMYDLIKNANGAEQSGRVRVRLTRKTARRSSAVG